jgi:hypothetical protein
MLSKNGKGIQLSFMVDMKGVECFNIAPNLQQAILHMIHDGNVIFSIVKNYNGVCTKFCIVHFVHGFISFGAL